MAYVPAPLVAVDASILSSYGKKGTGGPRAELTALCKLGKAGICVPEAGIALKKLNDAVLLRGGDFRVTELHRDITVQAAARKKYDHWIAVGKPPPYVDGKPNPKFDSKTMKSDKVALPGRSGHNAGRSFDGDIASLGFPGVPASQQLDVLWELAKPLGWTPIIKEAKEGTSESWHFDFFGELIGVLLRLGYEQWALCGAILAGHGDLASYEACVQALLCRAGFDIGKIDGVAGARTMAALASALPGSGATTAFNMCDVSLFGKLLALPAK